MIDFTNETKTIEKVDGGFLIYCPNPWDFAVRPPQRPDAPFAPRPELPDCPLLPVA